MKFELSILGNVSGGIGLEPQAVALAMSGAFQEFAEENTLINQSIKKIVVVVFDNSLVPVFQQHAIPLGKLPSLHAVQPWLGYPTMVCSSLTFSSVKIATCGMT